MKITFLISNADKNPCAKNGVNDANGANDAVKSSKTDRVTYYFSGKQISAADQIRIDKYMCQLDRMALI